MNVPTNRDWRRNLDDIALLYEKFACLEAEFADFVLRNRTACPKLRYCSV